MTEPANWPEVERALAPALAAVCADTPVNGGPGVLVRALGQALPDWSFRHILERGGWYRLGGIVDAEGNRVSDNIEHWVETELEARDGDLGRLLQDYDERVWFGTRLIGHTHYLAAAAGEGTADFLQLEIEDLREERTHPLFAGEPDSVEALVDPRLAPSAGQPLGQPYYSFRRLQHIGALLARMRAQQAEPAAIHRMVEDWEASSASHVSAWYNHWAVATREHLDRYRQRIPHAQPIPARIGPPPAFAAAPDCRGLDLQAALIRFDRASGYPMAWYFHMLTGKAVPDWVAQAVIEDTLAGFAYLPERDTEVVRRWIHRPYVF